MMPRRREPAGETTKLTVEVPITVWRAAKQRALDETTDLKSVVIAALESYLKGRPSRGPRAGRVVRLAVKR
jgi:hypothetical protein